MSHLDEERIRQAMEKARDIVLGFEMDFEVSIIPAIHRGSGDKRSLVDRIAEALSSAFQAGRVEGLEQAAQSTWSECTRMSSGQPCGSCMWCYKAEYFRSLAIRMVS